MSRIDFDSVDYVVNATVKIYGDVLDAADWVASFLRNTQVYDPGVFNEHFGIGHVTANAGALGAGATLTFTIVLLDVLKGWITDYQNSPEYFEKIVQCAGFNNKFSAEFSKDTDIEPES